MKTLRCFKSWILRRFLGYVRVSDYVVVDVRLSPTSMRTPSFNADMVIGPPGTKG